MPQFNDNLNLYTNNPLYPINHEILTPNNLLLILKENGFDTTLFCQPDSTGYEYRNDDQYDYFRRGKPDRRTDQRRELSGAVDCLDVRTRRGCDQ